MNLNKRIEVLGFLGEYLKDDSESYQELRYRAFMENKWFTPEYIFQSGKLIAEQMLCKEQLSIFATGYGVEEGLKNKTIGLVMAGNIPYVGFHDLLCIFLSGYRQRIKPSSKDSFMIKNLIQVASTAFPGFENLVAIDEMLKGCDGYIATGSDNSARYFEQYFSKYPHIIRKNRTSVAVLDGNESQEQLEALADDVQLYFGLGCRNVTQLLVPEEYDFVPLLGALRKYDYYRDHEKYRNNFDYQLTIAIMNNRFYMSNDSIVLLENESPFSPISQLHYQFYSNKSAALAALDKDKIQCIVGNDFIPFGDAQKPGLTDFPDGIDTMEFLASIP
jgi:hypothetical protein